MANANVGFLLGSQASVNSILTKGSGAKHGSFYLTSDTHRLYIGNEDTSLSPVNEGVITVESLNDLPTSSSIGPNDSMTNYIGSFYYVSDKNILCVYSGSGSNGTPGGWVQINANTNTVVNSQAYGVSDDKNNTATIKNTITNSDGSKPEATFTVVGTNGITVTGTGTALTISGDSYSLATANNASSGVDIQLNSANTTDNDSVITIAPKANVKGNNTVSISQADGVISISAEDTRNTSMEIATTDDKGDAADGFKVVVTDSLGQKVSASVDPTILYGKDGDAVAHFNGGNATLNVYTKSEIDETFRVLNAMHYKGTVGTSASDYSYTSIPTSGISIGDTFLIGSSGVTYNNKNLSIGSLLIARGTEDDDPNSATYGQIISDLTYDYVESTVDTDTTYKILTHAATNGGGIKLQNKMGGTAGILDIVGDNAGNNLGITVTPTVTESGTADGDTVSLKIAHETVTQNDTTGEPVAQSVLNSADGIAVNSITLPIITSISRDGTGHITGIETTNYTILDTNSTVESVSISTSAYSKKDEDDNEIASVGVISNSVATKNAKNVITTKTNYMTLNSSSLTIKDSDTFSNTADGTVTRQGLSIDMVWGSF